MPPSAPLIDDFNRNEAPLSDGGNWYQTHDNGAYAPTADDYTVCSTIFSGSANNYLVGGLPATAGPGRTIRQSNPGASANQEVSFGTTGTYGAGINGAYILLRAADLTGDNTYQCVFYDPHLAGGLAGATVDIYKVVGSVQTVLATGNSPSVASADMYVWAKVTGSLIETFAAIPAITLSWVPLASVTDTTYSSGYVGFGTRFMNINALHGGAIDTGSRVYGEVI